MLDLRAISDVSYKQMLNLTFYMSPNSLFILDDCQSLGVNDRLGEDPRLCFCADCEKESFRVQKKRNISIHTLEIGPREDSKTNMHPHFALLRAK